MSNSIIDQQRDNADFFFVQHSWLPGPVKRYNHEQDFLQMQNLGAKLVYPPTTQGVEGLMSELQKMLAPDNRGFITNPYYWTDDL